MSLHDDIHQMMRKIISDLDADGVQLLSPSLVSTRAYEVYGSEKTDIHVRYLAVEHGKQMARRILGAKYEADGCENKSHQGDMFSGLLQERYPLPRSKNAEPVYKPRELLTDAELQWNCEQLRKSAEARTMHADALEAYRKARPVAA